MNIVPTEQRLLPQVAPPPPPQAQENIADLFGVTAVFTMLRRRFVLMAIVGALVGALVLTNQMMATPRFMATALVAINSRQERVLEPRADVLGDLPRDAAAVDSEIEILRSPALTGRLVDELNLMEDPEFNWTLREPSGFDQFMSSLINPILRSEAPAPVELTPEQEEARDAAIREAIAAGVGGRMTIRRRGLTYVIEISGASTNPVRAQQLANTYADLYLESQAEARIESAQRATSWLSGRLLELSEDVQRKEAAVEEFRMESRLVAADGSSLTERQITEVQRSVLDAQAELAEREARYRQLRNVQASGGSLDALGDTMNSDTIRGLRDREADIARRQSDLENRYLPSHPSVQAIRSERQDIARQIEAEISRIAVSLGNEVDVARSRLLTLQESLESITGELQNENEDNIRLRELEREAAASRRVYENYLERFQEIVDQETLNTADARLVSHARTPGYQIAPNLRVSLALAIIAGGFVGLVAGVIAELLDRSIHGREDIESTIGFPMIASIPTIRRGAMRGIRRALRNPPGYLVEKPMSAFTEALRVLRTVIVHSRLGGETPVVAIASALPGEGKTTVAMSLARVSALSGQRVVVVDCDLRKQSISQFLEETPSHGLLQVLEGELAWRDVIRRDAQSQADVLPAAEASFTPIDVFGTAAMPQLLAELRDEYDIIILDCPPVLAVADARVLSSLADSVVFVARLGKSTLDAVRVAIDHIITAGGKVEGVALNRVPTDGIGRLTGAAGASYTYQIRSYYNAY